jgi:hypothetical protein
MGTRSVAFTVATTAVEVNSGIRREVVARKPETMLSSVSMPRAGDSTREAARRAASIECAAVCDMMTQLEGLLLLSVLQYVI